MVTVTLATVMVVLHRQDYRCVRCGAPIEGQRGLDWSAHHRRPRGAGGSRRPDTDAAVNILVVCGHGASGCHGYIESRRTEAFDNGWLVRQGVDPATVAVLVDHESRWTYCTEDGYADDPPTSAA